VSNFDKFMAGVTIFGHWAV